MPTHHCTEAGIIKQFEYVGFHVEIHLNAVYQKYFWVTGSSYKRFIGACEYFSSLEECESNARHELELQHLL
jgi:hypothetical protein